MSYVPNNECYTFAVADRAYCADIKKLVTGQFCLAVNSNESALLMVLNDSSSPIYVPIVYGRMPQINHILIDYEERILVFGSTMIDDKLHIFIARFLPSFVQDRSFGEQGFFNFILEDATSFSKGILQENGDIVCVGKYNRAGIMFSILFCLHDAGQLNRSFGNNGIIYYDQNISLHDLLVDGDGQIVVGGFRENDLFITRYTSSMNEQSFHMKLIQEEQSNKNDYLGMHLINKNESIFAALNTYYGSEIIQANLSTHSSKEDNLLSGKLLVRLDYPLQGMRIDTSNKFIGWSNKNGKINLVKFDLDGQLDQDFGNAGILQSRIGKYSAVAQLIEDMHEKYVVVGSSDESVLLAKYNKNAHMQHLVIKYPEACALKDQISHIAGLSFPEKKISIYLDGVEMGVVMSDDFGNWHLLFDKPLTNGKHLISARYVDIDELFSEKEITLNYPDIIEFTAPEKAAQISNISNIAGCCSQAHAQILLFIDGKFEQRVTSNFSGYWQSKNIVFNQSGEHAITAQLIDEKGMVLAQTSNYFEITKSSNFIVKLLGW